MNLDEKLAILSGAAKYDVSCSSSGSHRKNSGEGLGASTPAGVCHSWADDGRCISLLKILYTNDCIYDCKYCINRHSNDIPRATFTPDEVARLTVEFYRRNYIEGLFLSSGIGKSPDQTMEELVETVSLLRHKYCFSGYIHLKGIPGADLRLIRQAGQLADRLSINIELPTSRSLKLLAPQKNPEKLTQPMAFLNNQLIANAEENSRKQNRGFLPAGQTTQMIIGATEDSDQTIISASHMLYQRYAMKRVYYSAYIPTNQVSGLPTAGPPLIREHRLYQADWLMRFYHFDATEILSGQDNLDLDLDPKVAWAIRHPECFPMEVNQVSYRELLRIPGIGPTCALRIIRARRCGRLHYEDLYKMGIVLKRARFFITVSGHYYGLKYKNSETLRSHLSERPAQLSQLTVYDFIS